MNNLLDPTVIQNFIEVINSTKIFENETQYIKHYNLFSTISHRINDYVTYLNNNSHTPENENDFLLFIMFASMIVDSVHNLHELLKIDNKYDDDNAEHSYKYLSKIYDSFSLKVETTKPTDNKFFQYLRSLIMAHPFETNRQKFIHKNEIHYSPYILIPQFTSHIEEEIVGVRVYTTRDENIHDLTFPFTKLKNYVDSRYKQLIYLTENIKEIILKHEEEWQEHQIPENLPLVETLLLIRDTLLKRHEETSTLDTVIELIFCPINNSPNIDIVEDYRNKLIKTLYAAIKHINKLDYEAFEQDFSGLLFSVPKNRSGVIPYRIQKSLEYLNYYKFGTDDYIFGLEQADILANDLLNKYVKVDVHSTTSSEIRLLIRLCCYLDNKNSSI